jgi:Uma2 family endonuclease
LSVEQYCRMIETGILGKRDRVVLWQGQLVAKMTKHQPHTIAQGNLNERFIRIVPDGWHVNQDAPVVVGGSVPEPDLSVVREHRDDYPRRPPTAADVALVAEVADSSLRDDARATLAAYAAASIPVHWLVNLPESRIEVHTDPTGPAEAPTYRTRLVFGPDDEVPVVLDGREVGRVAVRDVLPREPRG